MSQTIWAVLVLTVTLLAGGVFYTPQLADQFLSRDTTEKTITPNQSNPTVAPQTLKILKDVGETHLDHFGLSESDFSQLKATKVTVIAGNFDICATEEDVRFFLDQSQKYDLKVIMPAGSGEAEWGYQCDQESYPQGQKPIWNKKAVTDWVNKYKQHPAVYGWDTSNEAGSVFPNAAQEYYLTLKQLQTAYGDVKAADSTHPVMIRQNGWFYYDHESNFFRKGNPFGRGVADIVMVNTYSNVEEYFSDFVTIVTTRALSNLQLVDPDVKVISALGVWEEKPLWFKPTIDHLTHDLDQLRAREGISGVAFFKYGAKGSEWYLPDHQDLWAIISK